MKKLAILIAGALLFFFFAGSAFSQNPDSGLTFPIEDLGGCGDLGSCTDYCEDPVNYNACSNFAKKNGFYQDDPVQYATDEFLQGAQNELGCSSLSSCGDFCANPDNFEACDGFAKRNDIPGGYTDEPDKPEYLAVAQEVLGCGSGDDCAAFCDDPANAGACSDFANQVGLLGGTTREGPGGCQSGETCGAYCSDPNNFGECSGFAPGGNFAGPGGCSSETSCRSFCEQNPDDCRSYAPGSNGVYVPVACPSGETHGPGGVCTAEGETLQAVSCVGADKFWDGNSCQDSPPAGITTEVPNAFFEPREDMGNCTTPGECYDFCKENPAECEGFDYTRFIRPTDDYNPYLYYTPGSEVKHAPVEGMGGCSSPAGCYDYCKDNPGQCEGFNDNAPRPPEIYIPGTYYTPPANTVYVTPPLTGFYTTPIYYTPPAGSTYTTPQYYTPGMYSTPSYQTPPAGSNYTTPNYYTPWSRYPTPTGEYPTPTYATPQYYTPPIGSNYTTPYYYTPPSYYTPYYYTPGQGGIASNYTTPSYSTPPPYSTPQYFTPYTGGGYTTPVYYTPPTYVTPTYYTPPAGSNYTSPSYYTPPPPYSSPSYYTPGQYPTPVAYISPPPYPTPSYPTPRGGSDYTSPSYYSPADYPTPSYYTPYSTPTYYTPPAGSNYTTPSYYTPGGTSYSYPTPYGTPTYGTPSGTGYTYPTPGYSYPTPGSYYTPGYGTPSYGTPSYGTPSYGTPSYGTPADSYGTPSYGTPSYGTPSDSYGTPSYGTPSDSYGTPSYAYPTPGEAQGVSTNKGLLQQLWDLLQGK